MDINTALSAIVSRLDRQDERVSFLSRLEYPQTLNGTLTSGSVVFTGSGGLLAQDNSNFFWDNANKRLGIDTSSPQAALHVIAGAKEAIRISSASGRGSSIMSYGGGTGDGIYLSANVYFDGSNWQRIETSYSAWYMGMGPGNGDAYAIGRAASGSNPVSGFTALISIDSTGVTSFANSVNVIRSSGSAAFALDGTSAGSAVSVANGNYVTPFGTSRVFSGLIIISETAINGNAAIFLVDGGGTVTLVGTAGATWSVTLGTLAKTNLGLVGNELRLENKLGSTATYNIVAIRTRTS